MNTQHSTHPPCTPQVCVAKRIAALAICALLATAAPAFARQATDATALSLEQLLDVAVVGASKYEQKQSDVAAAVSVITRQEIRAFGWRTLDEALASLPGVHTTYDRQYTYFGARGFGLPGDYNTRVLVTINGNRFNDPAYDAGPFGRQFPLDLDLVERIEYIPGPGGAVYGQNAMFAVVNVVTREGSHVQGAELSGGFQGPQGLREGRVTWGRKFNSGLDVLVSASGHRMRGEDRLMDFGAAGITGMAIGLDGGRGGQYFGRAARGAWSLEHVSGTRRKDDPTGAYLSDPLVPGQYQSDSYALTQLQYRNRLGDDSLQLSARAFAGRERYRSDLSYGATFAFSTLADWRGFEVRLLSTGLKGHTLMTGVEGQDNVTVNQEVEDPSDAANNLRIQSPGGRIGAYVQDEIRLGGSLATTLGLRVDRTDATGTKVSPRAGLIWHAGTNTTVKALYGRAHRAPNAYERDYDDGFAQVANPDLRGERVDTAELIVDRRIGRTLSVRGAAYRWDMHDIIVLGLDSASGITQYQPGPLVVAQGAEASADKTWDTGARLRGSLAIQHVQYEDGEHLINSPEVLGKLNLSAPLPWAGLRGAYELRYDSQRRTLDGTALSGHVLSNVQVGTSVLPGGLEASIGIFNLFNTRYEMPAADSNWQNAFEQDGRTLRVKVGYRF